MRDFHLPPLNEPQQNLGGLGAHIGADKSLRLELAKRITDEHPADRQWRMLGLEPQTGASRDLQRTSKLAIPVFDLAVDPVGQGQIEEVFELRQSLAFLGRPPRLAGFCMVGK